MGDFDHLTVENRDLLLKRDTDLVLTQRDLSAIVHWLRPCRVKVLLVVDGLDFSWDDFGLRTFVETLLSTGGYVRFQISLAHIDVPGAGAMMEDSAAIAERITGFKFDNPAHFTATKYDVVFLFGIATFYSRGPGYPADTLKPAELQVIAQFQNGGGGLFATGDHGALGKPLCHEVARARNMRLWDHTSGDDDIDEVSMGGPRRNDTNRLGHDGASQFNDQSDDIPQAITPKIYSVVGGLFRYSFPHPLLCGPTGVIRVMPDHPHEGECIVPPDPDLPLNFTGPLGQEYPPATGGGPRPLPEVIATLDVLAGTTSDGKDPTQPHSFGGICAYDGHRAGVGRVATDSTWHHFVNVNLIGDPGAPVGDPKRQGFLATASGQAHLEDIKAYYRNLAVWLSRPANLSCMRSRLIWEVVYSDRVLEAVLTTRQVRLADLHVKTLWLIGQHATNVIGRFAGQCQSRRIVLDLLPPELLERIPHIDPWQPPRDKERFAMDGVPWLDLNPLLNVALGGALVAINEKFGIPTGKQAEKLSDRDINDAAGSGAATALQSAMRSLSGSLNMVSGLAEWAAPPGRPKPRG